MKLDAHRCCQTEQGRSVRRSLECRYPLQGRKGISGPIVDGS